ncbi:hypothetical protein F6X66_06410 [Dickeya solani]|nr:hypothetical protein [Dickeya solani]MZG62257.1 hypothetical protein [Dickeya solani]MZH11150.1 hypothetical protein [Dickeya solani]MZH49373.1 hypothetical protein [Dickeya solani]MZI96469.1 hypothetical protein [Dickeya solani]
MRGGPQTATIVLIVVGKFLYNAPLFSLDCNPEKPCRPVHRPRIAANWRVKQGTGGGVKGHRNAY